MTFPSCAVVLRHIAPVTSQQTVNIPVADIRPYSVAAGPDVWVMLGFAFLNLVGAAAHVVSRCFLMFIQPVYMRLLLVAHGLNCTKPCCLSSVFF